MIIRAATEHDADALAAIYGHAVLHGFGTSRKSRPAPPTWRAAAG
jgi:L-amino acid N-acyltransferase YncA